MHPGGEAFWTEVPVVVVQDDLEGAGCPMWDRVHVNYVTADEGGESETGLKGFETNMGKLRSELVNSAVQEFYRFPIFHGINICYIYI